MSKIAIIGSGIAGLFSAIKIANNGHEVVIITKQRVGKSAKIIETLKSGDGLCN